MEGKKYRMREDMPLKLDGGITLYRIEALKDFSDVKKGDIGGWIEKGENLSQEGDCWVYGNAFVRENAKVFDNAKVRDKARLFNDVRVYGNANVYESAYINDNAEVFDYAEVYGDAWVCHNAKVLGHCRIACFAKVGGNDILEHTELV